MKQKRENNRGKTKERKISKGNREYSRRKLHRKKKSEAEKEEKN